MRAWNTQRIDVSTAFTKEVDYSLAVKSAIGVAQEFNVNQQAVLDGVKMRSASAFTAVLNPDARLQAALLPSGEYGLDYHGTVTQIVFDTANDVTLTLLEAYWTDGIKAFEECTFTFTPNTAEVTVRDASGNALMPTGTNKYALRLNTPYRVSAEATDYDDFALDFLYTGGNKAFAMHETLV